MNKKINKYIQSRALMLVLFSFCICDQGKAQNELAVNQLEQLSARLVQAQAPISDSTMDDVAIDFALILPTISLEPNYKAPPNINEITPNGVIAIRETTKIAIALTKSSNLKTGAKENIGNPSLIALDSFLAKLNGAIDPSWTTLPVSSNVMPPSGTPNAAAGMNPEAIADPNLKKQYLDLLKQNRDNGLKNSQQRALRDSREKMLNAIADLVSSSGEGWSKADLLARFCKDEESKQILERHIRQSE